MTVFDIKTFTTASNYEQIVTLDGIDFIMSFLWNQRADRWFMTLKDSESADLATGRTVCTNIPWAVHDTIEGMPAGQLWVFDGSGVPRDATLSDLGDRVTVKYVDEESDV